MCNNAIISWNTSWKKEEKCSGLKCTKKYTTTEAQGHMMSVQKYERPNQFSQQKQYVFHQYATKHWDHNDLIFPNFRNCNNTLTQNMQLNLSNRLFDFCYISTLDIHFVRTDMIQFHIYSSCRSHSGRWASFKNTFYHVSQILIKPWSTGSRRY